jgi:hypothetical protein
MKTAMTSAFLFTAALAFSGAALAHTNHESAPVAAAAGDKSAKKDSGKDSGKSAKKSKKDKDSKQAK